MKTVFSDMPHFALRRKMLTTGLPAVLDGLNEQGRAH